MPVARTVRAGVPSSQSAPAACVHPRGPEDLPEAGTGTRMRRVPWGASCVSFPPSGSSGSSPRQPRDHSPGFKTLLGLLTFLPWEVGVSPTPASGLRRPLSESSAAPGAQQPRLGRRGTRGLLASLRARRRPPRVGPRGTWTRRPRLLRAPRGFFKFQPFLSGGLLELAPPRRPAVRRHPCPASRVMRSRLGQSEPAAPRPTRRHPPA